MKTLRLTLGATLFAAGIILTLLPGSILLVLGGLLILSYDWPKARTLLKYFQTGMRRSACKADAFLLARKLR
ncbi:tellurium resistance protein TerC [Salinimonas sp. HHU 13199]|uniref:Tellurium resistance protein TerC n=1 Tax=Salinimonas profundi TaxID=2729140 RepID=A0ABR8LJ28_9ALTE|nr:PGPGW domain-containing protein [Salinimonas profundi]MBD3584322.1 tellurium resistance protein TerC [Salinimonas profundi]